MLVIKSRVVVKSRKVYSLKVKSQTRVKYVSYKVKSSKVISQTYELSDGFLVRINSIKSISTMPMATINRAIQN